MTSSYLKLSADCISSQRMTTPTSSRRVSTTPVDTHQLTSQDGARSPAGKHADTRPFGMPGVIVVANCATLVPTVTDCWTARRAPLRSPLISRQNAKRKPTRAFFVNFVSITSQCRRIRAK